MKDSEIGLLGDPIQRKQCIYSLGYFYRGRPTDNILVLINQVEKIFNDSVPSQLYALLRHGSVCTCPREEVKLSPPQA